MVLFQNVRLIFAIVLYCIVLYCNTLYCIAIPGDGIIPWSHEPINKPCFITLNSVHWYVMITPSSHL